MTRQILGQELAEKVRKLLDCALVPGVETQVKTYETKEYTNFDSTSATIELGDGVTLTFSLIENHKRPA